MKRREALRLMAAGVAVAALPRLALADAASGKVAVGAAWRGPRETDTHHIGVLEADWQARRLAIRYAVPLPSRPHGLLPEPDGGLIACAFRPGAWLMRCDGTGKVVRQVDVTQEGDGWTRLAGHAVISADGTRLYTTETDYRSGRGMIGVRDLATLKKLAQWPSHGIDPHQMLLDHEGHLIVANGGVPRTLQDRKVDLQRMDSSLVRLHRDSGELLGQWRLSDPRLSMRHIAWNFPPRDGDELLGIAMQAEHDDARARAQAPILAVYDGKRLMVPTRDNDGVGYCGDIAPAHRGGFVLTSHQPGLALLWHPGIPDRLQTVVKLENAYALTEWHGPGRGGGILVATAVGMGRWHPEAQPTLLPWPQPMALDNHWVLVGEA